MLNMQLSGMIGGQEILIILLIVLVLFGGKKIPELMKGLGKGVREYKDAVNSVEKDLSTNPNSTKPKELNKEGMVVDFTQVKKIIRDLLDHKYVNDIVDFNPTAENLARWICEHVPHCYKVSFQESENNKAMYCLDDE